MSFTRRDFLLAATSAGLAAGPNAASADSLPISDRLPAIEGPAMDGLLCVPIYGESRFAPRAEQRSMLAIVDARSGKKTYVPSPVENLHGLIRPVANNPNRITFGVGQESNKLDMFDAGFSRIKTLEVKGANIRGHGINYGNGVLLASELVEDPWRGGLLTYIDAAGQVGASVPSGGLRPHEIIECGKYLAVAHYGNLPGKTRAVSVIKSKSGEQYLITDLYDLINPGVAILDKATLALHAFVALPTIGAIAHLSVDAQGCVLAMGAQTRLAPNGEWQALQSLAREDRTILLERELYYRGYELSCPMYQINPQTGEVIELKWPAQSMRGAKSFTYDATRGMTAGTFGASHSIFIRQPGKINDKFISSLELGVSDPSGITNLPGGLMAVSGNHDNIAVFDPVTEQRVQLHGMPLGEHSHLYWFNAVS